MTTILLFGTSVDPQPWRQGSLKVAPRLHPQKLVTSDLLQHKPSEHRLSDIAIMGRGP